MYSRNAINSFVTNYILVQMEVVLHLVIQLHNHMDGVLVIC